jgi:hypothetical protein
VIAASHDAVATGDVTTLAAQTSQLRTAREAESNALAASRISTMPSALFTLPPRLRTPVEESQAGAGSFSGRE